MLQQLKAAAAHAAATAADVFKPRRPPSPRGSARIGGPRWGVTATAGTRPPTDVERAAARVLGRALDTAGIRDRVRIVSQSNRAGDSGMRRQTPDAER